MITIEQYFKDALVAESIADNAADLLWRVNHFLMTWDREVRVSSGYRSPAYNKTLPGAAKNSKHMAGRAIDLADYDRALARFVFIKAEVLDACGLWCEDMRCTKGWVHFQSVPPASGRRFFLPSTEWAKKLSTPLTLEAL